MKKYIKFIFVLNALYIHFLYCLNVIEDGKLKKYKKYYISLQSIFLCTTFEIKVYFDSFISYKNNYGVNESFLKWSSNSYKFYKFITLGIWGYFYFIPLKLLLNLFNIFDTPLTSVLLRYKLRYLSLLRLRLLVIVLLSFPVFILKVGLLSPRFCVKFLLNP